jgi:threonine/homoserine efflux transporter RhtA
MVFRAASIVGVLFLVFFAMSFWSYNAIGIVFLALAGTCFIRFKQED